VNTITAQLAGVLVRELTSLRQEIEAYPSDEALWKVVPGISNSGGTLALHLAGNLQHFIGRILGKSGYVRNRDAEFSTRGMSRQDVARQVDDALRAVESTVPGISAATLAADFPEPIGKHRVNTGDFLIHLASHLAYHLGQVDYHRRIVTGQATTVGPVAPGRLASARPVEEPIPDPSRK
jgi:uncharacterized damage-inducible protein DinB